MSLWPSKKSWNLGAYVGDATPHEQELALCLGCKCCKQRSLQHKLRNKVKKNTSWYAHQRRKLPALPTSQIKKAKLSSEIVTVQHRND